MGIVVLFILLILIILWFFHGRDKEKPVLTLEFYPPDDLDPMQIEYAVRGEVTSNSIYAMILYWVSQGYLKFITRDSDDVIGVERVKYLEDAPKHAQRLFNRLFKRWKRIWFDQMPEDWDLNTMLSIETGKTFPIPVFSDKLSTYASAMTVYLASWSIVIVLMGIRELGEFSFALSLFIVFLIYLNIDLLKTVITSDFRYQHNEWQIILLVFLNIGTLALIMSQCYHLEMSMFDKLSIAAFFFGGIFFCAIMPQRKNASLYGRILGFREFIKTGEADQLKTLGKDSPDYGIDILPYAVIFNMGTDWSNRCEIATLFIDKNRKKWVDSLQ